jgi:choline dehydrogenase-like flavoprotein
MVDDAGERATDMPAAAHDYDVLVIGSGFGGSVAALRLTEKGYHVGVLEAGRRFEDADYPTTSWEARKFLWAPKLGCKGIQRIHLLRDVIIPDELRSTRRGADHTAEQGETRLHPRGRHHLIHPPR